MSVREIITELNEFYKIQQENQELHQKINQLYSLINAHSKETTLSEALEDTLRSLEHNSQIYNELYQKYINGQDYSQAEFPMLIYRNLNVAIIALMRERELTFTDLEKELPYTASKLEDIVGKKGYHEDTHAVYCVLCDYFGLDKQQYHSFTKVERL